MARVTAMLHLEREAKEVHLLEGASAVKVRVRTKVRRAMVVGTLHLRRGALVLEGDRLLVQDKSHLMTCPLVSFWTST